MGEKSVGLDKQDMALRGKPREVKRGPIKNFYTDIDPLRSKYDL